MVYAKQPFLGPQQIIEYLGRYTHKVAISNHRLLNVDEYQVTFSYKDYRQQAKVKTMSLSKHEFDRRFVLHILPLRFVRIRHFGIFNAKNKERLEQMQQLLKENSAPPHTHLPSLHPKFDQAPATKCPCCKNGTMLIMAFFNARAPPEAQSLKKTTSAKN